MDFEKVFSLVLEKLNERRVDFALIGGFALHAAGHTRATIDIDFLVDKSNTDRVKEIMSSHGYEVLHESEDVLNFSNPVTPLGRIDFLLAHRKYAMEMLKRAREETILNGRFKMKVITPEDLIGLKVQSSSNDADRYRQDMADIEAVIRKNKDRLDMKRVREYFALFGREDELNKMTGLSTRVD